MPVYELRSGNAKDADYTPYGAVRDAILCHDPAVMLTGPADTGKSMGMLWMLHMTAINYPGASLVIARKTLTSVYATILQTFINKVLIPQEIESGFVTPYGGNKPQWFDYANGSRIWIAGLDKPGKILSAEHDIVYIPQSEEITVADWEVLSTRVTGRAGHIPFPRLVGDCNPAAPSHWILQKQKAEQLTLFWSTHRDNPEIFDPVTGDVTPGGEQRLARLRALTGSRYLRLFQGLWAFPEGAIYSMFDEERHKVKAFAVPQLWPRAVGIDPFGAEIAAVWVAFDPQAQVLNVYREYMEPFGLTTAEHAKEIRDKSAHETIWAWAGGGPSERAWRLEWEAAGIPLLEPPVGDVWVGIDRIIDLLNNFKLVIHDNCQNLLSEIGSYRRKMKNGVPTEQIEDKETYHCLVGDTLVTTLRGSVPLKDVVVGDQVLTRQGYRRVLDSACTHPCAPVYEAQLSNGAVLTGTAEHPVWVQSKGYTDLRALRYGDIIVTPNNQEVSQWGKAENENQLRLLTRLGGVIQSLRDGAINTLNEWYRFISMFGRCITADQFQKAISFTTLMETRRITTLKTLSPCPDPGMRRYTFQTAATLNDYANLPRLEESIPRPGRARQQDGSFIGKWANSLGKGRIELPRPVRTAGSPTRLGMLPKRDRGSVLTNAEPLSGASLALTTKLESVKPVGKSLRSINTLERGTARASVQLHGESYKRKQRSARIAESPLNTIRVSGAYIAQENVNTLLRVVSVKKLGERRPVYNLEVKDAHEFFANGILVHNCLDALRYVITLITQPGSGMEIVYQPKRIGVGL